MNLSEVYPAYFNHSEQSYLSLMRSVLIKASYDGVLKKMTGFKGMYLCQQPKECWTFKFDQFAGIFGLVFSSLEEGFGRFHLYYFPSSKEALIEKVSLSEALLAQEEDFIDKVRSFAQYTELLSQFYLGSLALHVSFESQTLLLFYETRLRQRVYSQEAIFSPWEKQNCVIEAGGLDKDLPTFRLVLPVMNFLNTALTRITCNAPSYFKLFKARAYSMSYDAKGVFEETPEHPETKLFVALGYGETDFDAVVEVLLAHEKAEVVSEQMSLSSFLQKAPWYDYRETNAFPTLSVSKGTMKPKLVVVTGFLGSGKTNFLQHYIEYETQKNRFVGIIQNEIGKTGLDGKLVDYDYSFVEIDEGCVCCSLAGQIRAGVNALMQKTFPDTILLETTGVANPFNLLSELNELEDRVDLEAIVTVVDGMNALYLAGEYRIFLDQIRAADVILLNKTDLMEETEIQKVEQFLYENNRCANIIRTVQCDIHPNSLSLSLNASTAHIASLVSESDEVTYTHLNDHLSSIKIAVPKLLCKTSFEAYLRALPLHIFRVKGIVQFEEEAHQSVVQFVHGRFEFVAQREDQIHEMFLVYIGKNMNQSFLQAPY